MTAKNVNQAALRSCAPAPSKMEVVVQLSSHGLARGSSAPVLLLDKRRAGWFDDPKASASPLEGDESWPPSGCNRARRRSPGASRLVPQGTNHSLSGKWVQAPARDPVSRAGCRQGSASTST